MQQYQEQEWMRNEESEGESEEEEEQEEEQHFCVACNKFFKSERQLENHQKSKRHNAEVARLQAELLAEERAARGDDGEAESGNGGEEEAGGMWPEASPEADNVLHPRLHLIEAPCFWPPFRTR